MSVGPFSGAFYLGTTCKRVPWLPCTVKASVNSFFTVTPSSLSLLRLKPGDKVLGTITVEADCPIEIRELASSAGDIAAVLKPGARPNAAVVEVAIAEGAEVGKREEQLNFTVASDEKSVRHTTRIHGVLRGANQTRQESAASQQDGKETPSG
ncbi:MAG: hypothetical protein GY851_09100 [bacterium]|nr:hypothetical protein [bacterium]